MTQDELESAISSAASNLQQWRSLLELPQWRLIEKVLEEQELERLRAISSPLENFSGALMQEYMKGEVSGLRLARALPRLQLESAQIDLDRLNSELETLNESTLVLERAAGGSRIDSEQWWGGDR